MGTFLWSPEKCLVALLPSKNEMWNPQIYIGRTKYGTERMHKKADSRSQSQSRSELVPRLKILIKKPSRSTVGSRLQISNQIILVSRQYHPFEGSFPTMLNWNELHCRRNGIKCQHWVTNNITASAWCLGYPIYESPAAILRGYLSCL